MKYLPLVWANLWRKRVRTVLTMISVVVAFVLFGILDGVTSAFDLAVERIQRRQSSGRSLVSGADECRSRTSKRIESVPGVRAVGFMAFFGGYFQERKNPINGAAIDASRFKTLMRVIVPDEQMEAMKRTRTGAIIGTELVDRYGWKIGDRVTLTSPWTRKDGSIDWEFDIVGIYTLAEDEFPDNDNFFINYAYFDEARAFGNGSVHAFSVTIEDAESAAQIAEDIDRLFANSPDETLTRSEEDTIHAEINRVGNISFIVNAIVSAVLFALLFVTGNTMMQAIRERTPELAVLKTYGYSNGTLMALVVLEAALLCLTAAGIGLGSRLWCSPACSRRSVSQRCRSSRASSSTASGSPSCSRSPAHCRRLARAAAQSRRRARGPLTRRARAYDKSPP